MLKILHLLTAAAALFLSVVPSLQNHDVAYFTNTSAIALALLGMLNIWAAAFSAANTAHSSLKTLASVLLLAATAFQVAVLIAPLTNLGTQPAILLSLLLALLASLLSVFGAKTQASQAAHAPAAPLAEGRELGTVKWFNTSKGFGFISRDSGDDIFVHFRAIRGEGHRVLVEGQRVEFSVINRDKGLQAEDVVPGALGPRT